MKQRASLAWAFLGLSACAPALPAQDTAPTAADAQTESATEVAETDGPAAEADDDPIATLVGDLAAETAKIEAAIESYVAAFNARELDRLVSHWSPSGVYVSRSSGERLVGHEAMKKEFGEIMSAENAPTLLVATDSIEFISPNVALERGAATVVRGEEETATQYSVVYVKHGDDWLIDRVSEEQIVVQTSHYDQLKDLEWLVGDWVDDNGDFVIEFECRWTTNQNYLSRKYSVTTADGVDSTGLQIIGWDAKQEKIRSWLFDSHGGFIEGEWTRRGDGWVVQSVATLADGAAGSFTAIFKILGQDSYSWHKTHRVLDGQLLPNLDEVVIRRK